MNQHAPSFYGASSTEYSYRVFSQNFEPEGNQFYNYIFASLSSEGSWIPVFIGQGNLKQYLSDQAHVREVALTSVTHVSDQTHIREVALTRVTHVLAHLSPDERQRRMEASDMLANHPHAHEFTGSNGSTLASASHLSAPETGLGIAPSNKSSYRPFYNEQAFKNPTPSMQSLDTVWARLRNKG